MAAKGTRKFTFGNIFFHKGHHDVVEGSQQSWQSKNKQKLFFLFFCVFFFKCNANKGLKKEFLNWNFVRFITPLWKCRPALYFSEGRTPPPKGRFYMGRRERYSRPPPPRYWRLKRRHRGSQLVGSVQPGPTPPRQLCFVLWSGTPPHSSRLWVLAASGAARPE